MSGFVYAVRCGDFVKIGYSSAPKKRAVKINSDNPLPCELLGFFEATREDERRIQKELAAHHSHSEWFRFEGAVLVFVKALPPVAPVRRYNSGRRIPCKSQRSFMRGLAKKHGEVSKWARELGLSPAVLSNWERVPNDRIFDVERVTGLPRHELRPDLYQPPSASAA